MDEFGYETDVGTRYRDFDTMGHVNNAVYATFLEQARMDYFRDVVGVEPESIDSVIVHLEIDYRRPITLEEGDDVSVAIRVSELGESSITMDHEIRAGDEVAATAQVILVSLEPSGEPTPLRPEWRDRIATREGF